MPPPVTKIKHYEILSMLGKGGMGEVYLAQDTSLNRKVAVKFLPAGLRKDQVARERFLREARAAAALDHPFICKIYETGEADGNAYIVMEYVEGKTIKDELEEKRFDLNRVLDLALEVAEALEAAHGKGIVHRDLKPSNLMCTPQGHIKVMDFGLAKHVVAGVDPTQATRSLFDTVSRASITTEGVIIGTLAYMSPEQAKGESVDARTDIFTLGIILDEMAMGKHPFDRPSPVETLTAVLRDNPPPVHVSPKVANPALGRILNKALAKSPSERYQKISEFAEDLRKLKADLAPRRWFGFRNRLAAAATVIAVASVLAAAGILLFKPEPDGLPPAQKAISVLIADFENRTGDPMFDGVLEQLLEISLGSAEHISLYDRKQGMTLIRRLDPGSDGRLTGRNAQWFCRREEIQAFVTASIQGEGDAFSVKAQAVDSVSGKVLADASRNIREKSDILKTADFISVKLRAGLGVIPTDSTEAMIRETFTTTSLEAMKAYADAQQLDVLGKEEEAIASYLRAIDLDPNFGRAYAGLAASSYARGEMDLAEQYYEEALKRIEQMTDREKHRTRGGYYLFKQNFKRAVEEYSALVEEHPKDLAGYSNLALANFFGYRMTDACREGLKAVELDPENLDYRYNQSWYALASGDFEKAGEEALKTLEIDPTYAKAYVVLALAEVALGRKDRSEDLYKQGGGLNSLGASYASTGCADLAIYEGRLEEAVGILTPGIAADIENKSNYRAADKLLLLAQVRLLQGKKALSLEAVDRALERHGREEILFAAALALIGAGEEDRARDIAGELGKRVQDIHLAYGMLLSGELSLTRKDTAHALKCFEDAQGLVDTWLGRFALGRAYLEAGAFNEALSEFEKCGKRRGEALSIYLNDLPTVRTLDALDYYVGRAQEGLGQADAAKRGFRKFLELKAGADKGLALVEDAQRRLAALPSIERTI